MSDEYDIYRKSIRDLFSGSRKYIIPAYQRRYSWTKDNAEQLFDDMIDTGKHYPSNLLGAMVVMTTKDSDKLEVVDGQQRLATLSLLFCAIRTYMYQFNDVTSPGAPPVILGAIEKLDDLLQVESNDARVRMGENDRDLFRVIICNKNSDYKGFCKELEQKFQKSKKISISHSLMINNYRSLCEKVEDWINAQFQIKQNDKPFDVNTFNAGIQELGKTVDNMIVNNHFASIQVTTRHVAYKIFNTFNSLGQTLQQADLIKSHLLSQTHKHESVQQDIRAAWLDIFDESLGKHDDFLYASLSSRNPSGAKEGISISMSNLYRIIESTVNGVKQVCDFIEDLKTDAKYFKQIQYPEDMDNSKKYAQLKSNFYGMQLLTTTYIKVPILAAYRDWENNHFEDLNTLVDCLLIFFFKFKFINDGTAENVRSIANTVTKMIIEKKDIDKILYHILMNADVPGGPAKRIDSENFQKNFSRKMFKLTSNNAKYILTSIETYLRKMNPSEYPNLNFLNFINYNVELEHILPKNHAKYWPEKQFQPVDPINNYKNRLGNLTLLSSQWNKSLRNKDFITKKTSEHGYAKSAFLINKRFLQDYGSWTAPNLEDREEQLCRLAPSVWDLDKYDKYLKGNGSTT